MPLGVMARPPGRWPGGLQENRVNKPVSRGRGREIYARYPAEQAIGIDVGGTSVQNRLNIAFGFAIFLGLHAASSPWSTCR